MKINDFTALWFINVHVVKMKIRNSHLSFIIYLNFYLLGFLINKVRQVASPFRLLLSTSSRNHIKSTATCTSGLSPIKLFVIIVSIEQLSI